MGIIVSDKFDFALLIFPSKAFSTYVIFSFPKDSDDKVIRMSKALMKKTVQIIFFKG